MQTRRVSRPGAGGGPPHGVRGVEGVGAAAEGEEEDLRKGAPEVGERHRHPEQQRHRPCGRGVAGVHDVAKAHSITLLLGVRKLTRRYVINTFRTEFRLEILTQSMNTQFSQRSPLASL